MLKVYVSMSLRLSRYESEHTHESEYEREH